MPTLVGVMSWRQKAGWAIWPPLLGSVGVGLVAYAVWEFSGGGVNHPVLDQCVVLVVAAAASMVTWLASRRSALDPRTRSAWRWIAAGSVCLTAAYGSTLGYQLVTGAVPFPSMVDVFFLSFYPLFIVGVLRFPTRPVSRHARIRLGLDAATIALAGASIVWYLVLGPTVAAGGPNVLTRIVSGAYPTGDLLQIFALARLLTRVRTQALRLPLRLLGAALVAGVAGDTSYGWLQFHPNATGLSFAHFILLLATALALLAAASQRRLVAPSELAVEGDVPRPGRAIWLPYFAPLAVLGLLIKSQFGDSLFPRLSLTIAAAAVMLLVALRQLAVQRELIAANRIADEQAKELHHAVVELEDAQRMKDEFISVVSHELRTPLTSIRGYTELLLEEEFAEEHRGFLKVIDRSSARLLSIVEDLLLVAQMQTGAVRLVLADFLLNAVIEQAGEAAQPLAASRNIVLKIATDPDLAMSGDASRMAQVLDNLISNALKYTPDSGKVSLTTTLSGENAVIEVADSGIGIPAAEQDQIFDRFFRTSNAQLAEIPGTGLGLVVTRGIVEAHGGTLDFESTEGIGTTFRIVMPLLQAPQVALVA
jgi:signal transduction histidine kinase